MKIDHRDNEVLCQVTRQQVLVILEWYQSGNVCQTPETEELAEFLYSVL